MVYKFNITKMRFPEKQTNRIIKARNYVMYVHVYIFKLNLWFSVDWNRQLHAPVCVV